MNPKGRDRENPQQEYKNPFEEFEYQMKEFDRLNAEFDEMMKIPEIEDFEKEFKKYDQFFNDPARYKELIYRLMKPSGKPQSDFKRNYGQQDQNNEAPGNKGRLTITQETLIVRRSYLRYRSILKELKDEMSSEEETSF